jgi:hypothetical protein
MKLTITVDTERFPDCPWPTGMPLPRAGDEIVVNRGGAKVCCLVDRCSFDLSDADHDTARIHIFGHSAPSGTV